MEKDDQVYAQVFFLSPNDKLLDSLTYLTSINAKWSDLNKKLMAILEAGDKGSHGASVGILKQVDKLPSLRLLDSFFKLKTSYQKGFKISIIVLSAFKDCKTIF